MKTQTNRNNKGKALLAPSNTPYIKVKIGKRTLAPGHPGLPQAVEWIETLSEHEARVWIKSNSLVNHALTKILAGKEVEDRVLLGLHLHGHIELRKASEAQSRIDATEERR